MAATCYICRESILQHEHENSLEDCVYNLSKRLEDLEEQLKELDLKFADLDRPWTGGPR